MSYFRSTVCALFAATILTLLLAACEKEPIAQPTPPTTGGGVDTNRVDTTTVDTGTNNTLTFAQVIQEAGPPATVTPSRTVEPKGTELESGEDTYWNCKVERVDISLDGGGSGGYSLYSPNASVVYPGNLLQGGSLAQATPDVIPVKRAGGTFSTDVIDGSIAPSFTVDEVAKSSVTEALNNIIAQSTGVVPANFTFSYEEVQSQFQLAASLRMSYESFRTQLEGKLSFSTDRRYTRYVVKLNQSFYTMSYDLPTSLEEVFAPSVTPQDLARYTSPGNPVTYISDVTYGRIYYMLIESTSTRDQMSAAISGSFNGVAADIDGEANVDAMRSLSNLKIKVFGYGGDAGTTIQTIGETNLEVLADLLARAGTITTGKPLSYVVRSLYDNKIVGTSLATSYDLKTCKPSAPADFPYTARWTGQVLERMGPIGAAYAERDQTFILISKDSRQYMRSTPDEVTGPFPISELFNGVPFPDGVEGITAAASIEGNERPASRESWVQFYDETGKFMFYWTGRGFSEVEWILNERTPGNPFKDSGIGAMAGDYTASGSSSSNRYKWNKRGDEWTYFNYNKDGSNPNGEGRYSGAARIDAFGPDGPNNPFRNDGIGAALGFSVDGKWNVVQFNAAGTEYTVYTALGDDPSARFYGKFPL